MGAAASVLVATLAVHADASEYANAVYNVVCLAQQVPCTQAKYQSPLEERAAGGRRRTRHSWIAGRSIVRAAEMRVPAPPDAPLLANYLSFYPALRQRQSIVSLPRWTRQSSARAFQDSRLACGGCRRRTRLALARRAASLPDKVASLVAERRT